MNDQSNVKVSFLGSGLAVVLILFIIPGSYLLRETLIQNSSNLIVRIQHFRNDSLTSFFKTTLYIGSNYLLVVVPPMLFHIYNAPRAVKQTFVNCFGMYFYSIVALITKEPRPYWITSRIHGLSCETGFASPFLELYLAAVLYGSYSIEIFHRQHHRYKGLAYAITGTVVVLMAFGGIYLGQNYPHQIFVTYCYTYVYVTTAFTFDEEIMKISMTSCFNYWQNRKYQVHWFAATLFLLLGAVSVYDVITLDGQIEIEWIKNASQDCELSINIGGASNFLRSAWVFYSLGVVFGCMFSAKWLPMEWWRTSYLKRIIRGVISAGVSVGIFYLFRKKYTETIPDKNTTSVYVFQCCVPYFIMAFCVFGALPVAFTKVKLVEVKINEIEERQATINNPSLMF
jgi:hypothetical protein